MLVNKGLYKKTTLACYNPYAASWREFLANYVLATLADHEAWMPERYNALVVADSRIADTIDFGKITLEGLGSLHTISKREFRKLTRSRARRTYDVVLVLDGKRNTIARPGITNALKRHGMLFVLFSPKLAVEDIERELDRLPVFVAKEIVLSQYHVLEFLRRKHPDYQKLGAELGIYLGEGGEFLAHVKAGKEPNGAFERFVVDWIEKCRMEIHAKPKIEFDGEEGILKISCRYGKKDPKAVERTFYDLISKHRVTDEKVTLRLGFGMVEVDVKQDNDRLKNPEDSSTPKN